MHATLSPMRALASLSPALLLLTVSLSAIPAEASWPPGGIVVAGDPGSQFGIGFQRDGQGGMFTPWAAETVEGYEVRLKRFDAGGNLPGGWPASGRLMAAAPLGSFQCAPDGNGGLYVLWGSQDYSNQDFRVSHFDASGLLSPGWPANGRSLSGLTGFQRNASLVADGTGAYACWLDLQDGDMHVRIQRFLVDGTSPIGWPEHGLTIKPGFSSADYPVLALGSDGKLWVGWNDDGFAMRTTSTESPSYRRNVQHVLPQGIIDPAFPAAGIVVGGWDLYAYLDLVADDAGGVYVTWTGNNAVNDFGCFAQHFTVSGAIAAGWPTNGHRYGASNFLDPPGEGSASDGLGGLLTSWLTYDIPTSKMLIRVQRLLSGGQTAGGWDTNGVLVGDVRLDLSSRMIVPDLVGGATILWTDSSGTGENLDVVARVILAGGQARPETPAPYLAVGGPGNQQLTGAIGDAAKGVFLAWNDDRADGGDAYVGHVMRSQIVIGVPVDRPRVVDLSVGNPMPNPSSGSATVMLSLPRGVAVDAEVLDLAGRRQRTVVERTVLAAGDHPLVWDGRDDQGRSTPPGIYLFRVRVAGGESRSVRLLRLR